MEEIRKRIGQEIDMKMCMMGPKGVGKTSILTSIFSGTQTDLIKTNLSIRAQGTTQKEIENKVDLFEKIFAQRESISERPASGLLSSSEVSTFDFQFGLKGKKSKVNLCIKDFPGEFVKTHPDDVISFIDESSAIMIAIDTPHLMEQDGEYAKVKNQIETISSFFGSSFSQLDSDKLVMLVPLKCEKYFYEKNMQDVMKKVEKEYASLINFFRAKRNVACAITPILTLGGVVFSHFSEQLNGDGVPAEVVYKFYEDNPAYSPAFCAQPLYYVLSFAAAQYQKNKRNLRGLNKILSSLYQLFENDKDLYKEILKMNKFRLVDKPELGYKLICGEEHTTVDTSI